MKTTHLLSVAALGLTLFCGAAAAQQPTPAPEVKRIGDFAVRCFPVKSVAPCDLYEDRVNKDTGQRVLAMSLAYMPSQNRYVLQLTVPLGVMIEKGVVVTGAAFTSPPLPFRRCDQAGCYVEAPVTKELIDQFAKLGSDAKLRVVPDGGDGKPFELPFSFDGFSSAHDEMVASNKAKAVNEAAAPAK